MTKMVKTKLNGQYEIILPEHRAKRPEWHTPEGWEKARLDHMHEYITKEANDYLKLRGGPHQGDGKPRPVVYYVGAEEGEMCALLQNWGAELVMFEPNPLVWPNIKAIWQANKMRPPLVDFAGFAANETDIDIEKDPIVVRSFPPSSNGKVISDHGFKNLSEADGTIPKVKIDDMVENGMPVPNMITMDVEGAEIQVLWGAEQTLRKHRPVIYLSLHPEFLWQNYHEYSHDLREWIKAIGYKETLLDYQHEVHLVYEPITEKKKS
jgi:FkbM family methyltransferase